MPDRLKIGFVGFGEAAFHIAKSVPRAELGPITAYDINTRTPQLGEKIRQRALEADVRLLETNVDLAKASGIILSTVTANQAEQAAQQTAPFLSSRHIYADLNSISPGLKQSIARPSALPAAALSKSR